MSEISLAEPTELDLLRNEKAAGEFWRGVFDEVEDETDREKIAKELSDYHFMMDQVPAVYMHVTGGLLSKCNYHAETVCGAADDYSERHTQQAIADACEERDARLSTLERENEELREALKPFAKAADDQDGVRKASGFLANERESMMRTLGFDVADLRRARKAREGK